MTATHISFYILSPQKKQLAFDCQLISTVLAKSEELMIVVAASELLLSLDDRLWSLSDVAFIPHQIIQQLDAFYHQKIPASVVLTDNIELVTQFDGVVINLTNEAIVDTKASRLLEVIDAAPEQVESGRHKYCTYQAQLQALATSSQPIIQVFQIR